MKQFIHKIIPSSIILVLSTILLFGGYTLGARTAGTTSTSVAAPIINTESSTKDPVDFSTFWRAWDILDANFIPASSTLKTTTEEKVWGAIEGLAASYKDPYTVFFPPEELKEFEEDIQGNFEGVGIEIVVKEGVLTIVSPLKNTPADRAGLRAQDKIIKIDTTSTYGMSTDEATKLIRGAQGTPVTFTIVRDGKESTIKVIRDVIDIPVINYEKKENGVFVIQLYSFSANATSKFREALREFVKAKTDKMVIDLRGNPGGYLEAAVDIASWFLPRSKVIVSEDFGDKDRPEEVFKSKGYDAFNDKLKLVILIDEGSASASEILAGALQEHGKATLVGSKSFGKGSVQELIPLSKDASLKVTIAHWLTPRGNSISAQGITPDVLVPMTEEDKKGGKDPQMDKAFEILLSRQ